MDFHSWILLAGVLWKSAGPQHDRFGAAQQLVVDLLEPLEVHAQRVTWWGCVQAASRNLPHSAHAEVEGCVIITNDARSRMHL